MPAKYSAGQELRDTIRAAAIETEKSNYGKLKLLLGYGSLAPSTHNTQPWQFAVEDSSLKIFIDFSKSIPVADPARRDMYISLGALIQNILLAAGEFGVGTKIEWAAPLRDSELVATINFSDLDQAKNPTRSLVLDGIVKRQNYRGFFTDKFDREKFNSILKEALGGQTAVKARTATAESDVKRLAELTAKGLRMGYAMPAFRREIGSYINHNFSRKKHGLHGYSLRLSAPQSFIIPKVMKRKDIGPKLAALNYRSFILSPVVVALATDDDDEAAWLKTGQVMEELMVRLSAAGLAASIYTASIEMPGLRRELMDILSIKQKPLPQVLFCVGTPGAPLPYSVRKHLSGLIRH